jgi:hypothetical protein
MTIRDQYVSPYDWTMTGRVGWRSGISPGICGAFVAIAAYAVTTLAAGYEATLASFQDDASYYFVIAENVVRNHRSTFDGITATNGYHPLWFALNVLLVKACQLDRHAYVTALIILCSGLAAAHAALLRRLLSSLVRSVLLADIMVLLVVLRCLPLSFCGMECALAMPLLAACALLTLQLARSVTPIAFRSGALGLFTALTALARLDAILFGLGCAALVLFSQRARGLGPVALLGAAFFTGLSPFFAYLSWNWATQGTLMTTSAESKLLAPGLSWNSHLFDQLSFGGRATFLYVPLAAAVLLTSPWTPWRGLPRRVALMIFAFPVCYYTSIALRSSWLLWVWYLYPLPLCMAVGLAVLSEGALAARGGALAAAVGWLPRVPRAWLYALSATVVSISAVRAANKPRSNQGVMNAALRLDAFSHWHAGQYAMGDRAGLTALLVNRSFLQLEGLVADRALLNLIREQRSLPYVLAAYHVDYLVEALPTSKLQSARCQQFSEPKERQAGIRSPKLRGTFCDPLFRYDDPADGYTTLVYSTYGESVLGPISSHGR